MSDYSEAMHWTADDDRDFGPSEDEAPCVHCGARCDEDCHDDCTCDACFTHKRGAWAPRQEPAA